MTDDGRAATCKVPTLVQVLVDIVPFISKYPYTRFPTIAPLWAVTVNPLSAVQLIFAPAILEFNVIRKNEKRKPLKHINR